jgi:DNA-binding transcriptional MocR family regulator
MPNGRQPRYLHLADTLRERIQQGVYSAGISLPFESAMREEHGVGRMTIRRALAVLREEGLISTRRGAPSVVRTRAVRQLLVLQPNERLVGRMPSRAERTTLALHPGVPLLVVRRTDGSSDVYAADKVEVVTTTAAGPPS